MQTPETQTDRASFNRMLVTVIGRNTKVKVLESKGWLSVWHKVNVLSDDGIVAIGWILTEVVKSAKKQQRMDPNLFLLTNGVLSDIHTVPLMLGNPETHHQN